MHMKVMTVTPALARDWLQRNAHNRNLSERTVGVYARDMIAGRWALTSEPIAFDPDGNLLNGQHRLSAVALANVSVPMSVVFDAPRDQFAVIDQGLRRSTGQVLAMEGVSYATHVAAAARMILRYERMPGNVWGGGGRLGVGAVGTNTEVLTFLRDHKLTIPDHIGEVRRLAGTTQAVWIALAYIVDTYSPNRDAWDDFNDGVATGANLSPGDSRLALRNYRPTVRWGSGQALLLAGLIAWNHFVAGRDVQMIRASRAQLPMPRVL